MFRSKDVADLQAAVDQLLGKDAPAGNGPDAQRYWLARQLLSMYTDLYHEVDRSGETQYGAFWFGRIGLAATAVSSAVAGTILATGPKSSEWSMVVGYVTASLGVIGAVAAALKLNDMESTNRTAHAGYLVIWRRVGAYLLADFGSKSPSDIEVALSTFASQIAAVESPPPGV
jgi:hypothetical protein